MDVSSVLEYIHHVGDIYLFISKKKKHAVTKYVRFIIDNIRHEWRLNIRKLTKEPTTVTTYYG